MSEREPITAELRAALDVDREFMRADGAVVAQTFCVDRGAHDGRADGRPAGRGADVPASGGRKGVARMSMLSAQCDELRSMAESVGLAMPQAATLMMEAADTITELRGALQVASVDYRHLSDENAKLRELLAKARDPRRIGGTADPESFVYAIEQLREFRWQHATNDEEAIPYINNVADAYERENAKLRELVDYMTPIALYAASERERDRMRELGAEVDG